MKLFFLFLSIIFFISCTEDKIQPQLQNQVGTEELPSHESWSSKITFTEFGKLKAVLFSNHLKKYDIKRATYLEGVKINFYSDQKIVSTLTSKRGRVDDVTQDMYAIDSVVAVNDSGTVLTTSELKWRNNDEKIITDKFVKIVSTKEIIEGYGLESDQQLRNYVIFNVTYSAVNSEKK
ncbi:MAG: LPS export ABC transporter periplasmic protein LptC [Ignavibacteria bacterium]|nr:LPS export ABC transporter periplasmic protein LptC [Ignavibacteria bacterium]